MIMSKTALCCVGLALACLVGPTIVVSQEKKPVKCDVKNKMDRTLKYRVARTERTVSGPPTLLLYISINPQHFNHDELLVLAHQLNQDFCKEPRLIALIFSDYRAAKSLVFNIERPSTYSRDYAALRGGYNLDRTTNTEYLSFSPDPNKPHNEIKIEVSNSIENQGRLNQP
jgi:hypothetical protein